MLAIRRKWQSIDLKLPLLTSGLVVVTALILATTAHLLVERTLLDSAGRRLMTSAGVVAQMVTRPRLPDSLTRATDAALRAYVRGDAPVDSAVAALSRPPSAQDTQKVYAALLDSSGRPVLAYHRRNHGPLVPRWPMLAIARSEISDTMSLSPLENLGGMPTYSLVRALRQTSAPSSPLIGYVVESRVISGRGAARFREMIGRDVQLLIGQPGAGVWTDLERLSAAPPAVPEPGVLASYHDGIGATATVPGTAWRVWVGQQRGAILAPARTLLWTSIPGGLAIALIGAAVMWRVTRGITRPIVQLTEAAENVAADSGDSVMHPTVMMPSTANEVARLRYAFERMARRVAERQTLEMQLRHAQKMEAVGRLAGGVAHDFNNLLTAIRSYADLMIEDMPEWDPKRGDAMEIRKAAERAAGLTAQLLAFSRKQMLQPRVLDSDQVIRDLEDMLKRLLVEDIRLEVEVQTGLWRVKADRGQLEQVIVNLAVNARDAMAGNGGTLTIKAANVTLEHPIETRHDVVPPGEYVTMAVSDNGVGMDVSTQNRLFEPFFTTKPFGEGTGLGLATVSGIIAQSGGFVTVASVLKQGTTFTVYLPRATEPPSSATVVPVRQARRNNETILLVEDEHAVRALAMRVLTRSGFRILEAEAPSKALELAQQHGGSISLILSDVVMPEMSGPAMVSRLADICPTARVLYISGYTNDEVICSCLENQGVMLLQKPFSAQELVERVRQALDVRPEAITSASI